MLLWDNPDDMNGFEEYLEAQGYPKFIRVRMRPATADERVPEPDSITGATFPCGEAWEPEDTAARLARMLQREEMANNMLWGDLERVKADRDRWRRSCGVVCGAALAALMALAAVWR